jgi:hypothetical protein
MKRMISAAAMAAGLLGCYGGAGAGFGRTGSQEAEADAESREGARVSSLPLLVLGVAQIYTTSSLADFSLFDMVESWKGANPTTLKESMVEIQPVKRNGVQYFLIARRNRLDIALSMDGGTPPASLFFDPPTLAWYAETGLEKVKLAEWADEKQNVLMLIHPDGKRVAVHP